MIRFADVDGYSIYKPEKFTDAGLDADVVKLFTKKLNSGDMIYVNNLTGVYGLEKWKIPSCTN